MMEPRLPQRDPRDRSVHPWLAGGGEMAGRIAEFDWERSALGPLAHWPQSLRTSVSLMLNSRHPMWIGWGPEATFLYNDAYVSVLSLAKHPWALGRPAAEVWAEIWNVCGPLAANVFERAEPSFVDDVELFMNRGAFIEETYYSFSYSPIRDESGGVGGLFCPSSETSAKVLNARRLATLSELAAHAFVEKTVEGACAAAFATLGKNPRDLPFAACYLLDPAGGGATRAASAGLPAADEDVFPSTVALVENAGAPALPATPDVSAPASRAVWPIARVVGAGVAEAVRVPASLALPSGLAGQAIAEAMVMPVTLRGDDRPLGVFVAGVSPARPFDAEYRTFFELLAHHLATAIQNARAAEEDRRRAEALAELDRAKTAFFHNVSHEFRTPLTLMLGPLEELLTAAEAGPLASARPELAVVHRNSLRLLKMVNVLLDFSRLEAGRMQVSYVETDLAAQTAELASIFHSAMTRAGLTFVVECARLPAPVWLDREMWEQVVFNLLSNALKFTFRGEVRLSLAEQDGAAVLRVRDSGIGIPPEELPKVFQRFHRVEGARGRTHEGTGIGLALVAEVVKLHGGRIAVESVVDRGTEFTLSLPFGHGHLPREQLGQAAPKSEAGQVRREAFVEETTSWLPVAPVLADSLASTTVSPAPSGGREPARILVAEDNADLRDYLHRLLSPRYRVEAVPDGEAAWEAIRRTPPELIVSDVMMPRLDGFGLVRRLRADPHLRTTPILLLSARAGEEARIEGSQHGADDYLIKPFSARELLARIATHLELARLRREAEVQLRRSHETFFRLIENAPFGVYVVDARFRLTQVSAGAQKVFSNIDPLLGRDFAEILRILWTEPFATQAVARFRHTLETGEPFNSPETVERRQDIDEVESYDWRLQRLALPDGTYGVVCYFYDTSERNRAQAALRVSEERLRLASETAQIAVHDLDVTSGRLFWSPSLYAICGVAPGTPVDFEQSKGLIHQEDRSQVLEAMQAALDPTGDGDFAREFRIVRPCDGRIRWLDNRSRTFFTGVGAERRASRNTGVVVDITERREAQARTELLGRLSHELALVSDPLEINRVATRLLGEFLDAARCYFLDVTADESRVRVLPDWSRPGVRSLEGDYPLTSFGKPEWWQAARARVVQIEDVRTHGWTESYAEGYAGIGIGSYAIAPFRKEGHWVASLGVSSMQPRRWSAGEMMLLEDAVARVWPLIERARTDAALREAHHLLADKAAHLDSLVQRRTARLNETVAELEAFSYSIAHDLRGPLRAMTGFSDALLSDYGDKLDAVGQNYLGRIVRAAGRMDRLILDVLSYGRVVRGEWPLEAVDLRALLEAIVDTYPGLAAGRLELVVQGELPVVSGNEAMLTQVFSNLLENAAKFTRPGVKARVNISAQAREGRVRVLVEDNGIGIAPAHREQVFEIFKKLGNQPEGTGIGLAVVKKAVERMGGAVGVEGNRHGGSTFWLDLRRG